MPAPASPSAGLSVTSDLLLGIERWFVRRGVPQLIEGYSTEARMDARATPWIAAWLVTGTILFWGTRPDWTIAANVVGIAATLAFVLAGYAAQRMVRGRPISPRLGKFDLLDIGSFAVLPAIPAAVIDGSVRELIVATLNALLGIGVIYVAVVFGLLEMAVWAVGRLQEQLTSIVSLVARTLPLLLILVVFLLFAAELWEAAHMLDIAELLAVFALLGLVAGVLVVSTGRAELRRLEARPWPDLKADAAETPAALLATADATVDRQRPLPRRLSWLQRANIVSLMLVSQLLQSAFVALVVMVFLIVLGLLVIPESVQEAWVGEPVETVVAFDFLDEGRMLSLELLNVSAFLSAIVGLYFTGLAVSEPGHREEHFGHVVAEVGQVLAARAYYLAAMPDESAVTVARPPTAD
jgi:hypothetical protein